MNKIHLTDEVLQAFLLEELQDNSITKHLSECSQCRKKWEDYQYLITCVPEIETEAFSFDLTALAMDGVLRYEQQKKKREAWIFWWGLLLLVMVISAFSIPYIPEVMSFFYSESIFTMLWVIGTGLLVLLFSLTDMMLQYKMKERILFKNNLQPII